MSGTDRHLVIDLQVVEAHPLFPYFLEKSLSIPTSPFFNNYSKWFFCYLVPYFFRVPLTFFKLMGGIFGRGKIKMASASTPSVNEPAMASF